MERRKQSNSLYMCLNLLGQSNENAYESATVWTPGINLRRYSMLSSNNNNKNEYKLESIMKQCKIYAKEHRSFSYELNLSLSLKIFKSLKLESTWNL